MEAVSIKKNLSRHLSLKEATTVFFKANTPDTVQLLFWKMFQCWVTRDCNIKADLSDEEVALFFDQLIDLVAAAHIEHEANRASGNSQHGGGDE